MQQADQINLNFSKSLNLALEQSQTRHDHFLIDKATFALLFPLLGDPFEPNWQLAIQAADALPTDAAVDNEQQILTDAVNQQLFLGNNLLGELYGYVEEAFPNKPVIWNFFGKDRYGRTGLQTLALRELMQEAFAACSNVTYKPALIAAGFLQPSIDLINTIQASIWTTNRAQELFKGEQV